MSNITVIDNFLPQEQFDYVAHHIPDFIPWNYLNSTILYTGDNDNKDKLYDWQMTHMFYKHPHFTSDEYDYVKPIVDKLNPLLVERIKANLSPNAEKNLEYGFHTDVVPVEVAKQFMTAIYYVNTNNGYTTFEDGTKVNSVANRLVTFSANIEHTGTTCTDTKNRVVINFVYIQNEINDDYS